MKCSHALIYSFGIEGGIFFLKRSYLRGINRSPSSSLFEKKEQLRLRELGTDLPTDKKIKGPTD